MNQANGRVYIRFEVLRQLQLCSVAGCLEPVEFAHKNETGVNGRGRGKRKRFYDIVNHPECYLPLCHDHHKLYDRGELQVSGCVMFGWLVPVESEGRALERYLAGEIFLPELIEARL
jgi:hypothetical protein